MCDALSAAGALLTVAGMGANMIGQSKVQGARNAVWQAENTRQRQITQNSANLFDQTLPKAGRPAQEAAVSDAADERTGQDTDRLKAFPTITPDAGQAPKEIGGAFSRALRGALNRNIDRAGRTADVNAYGDATRNLNVDLARSGQWQTIFGNQAVNSSRLTPGELDQANTAGSGWSSIGGLLGGAGRIAGAAGASGVGPGWADIFGTSAARAAPGAGLAWRYDK
jgi:hypothetical protein